MIATSRASIDVGQDLDHQKLEWRIEHIGWGIILFVLIAALLGVLGPGPVSWATVHSDDRSLAIEYSRVQHYEAPAILRIDVQENAIQKDEIRLAINSQFIDSIQITQIDPQPSVVLAGSDFYTYVFAAHQLNGSARINFHHEPNEFGGVELVVQLEDGPSAKMNVFVFP